MAAGRTAMMAVATTMMTRGERGKNLLIDIKNQQLIPVIAV